MSALLAAALVAMPLDAARWAELVEVQRAVATVPAGSDRARFGRDEAWTPDAAGDCEDKALAARDALAARGWPAGALGLALAFTERGEYHAVLTVEVGVGGRPATLVLDNRFPAPLAWDALSRIGYRWTVRQTPSGWARVSGP